MRANSATIGVQLASTVTFLFDTPYSELVGLVYIALASSMACRVFRMVLLSSTVADAPDTAEVASALKLPSAEEFYGVSHHGGELIPLT